jgi:translation initiation factor IF-2
VRDFAKELGMSDRDLVAKAGAHGMVISTLTRLTDDQVTKLRNLIAPGRAGSPAVRATTEKPVAASSDSTGRTVVRRRVATAAVDATAAEVPHATSVAAPAPAASPTPAVARTPAVRAETPAPQPVAVAAVAPPPAAETSTPAPAAKAPAPEEVASATAEPPPPVKESRPRLRRVKAEDIEPPPELHLRVSEPTPKPPAIEPQPAPAAPAATPSRRRASGAALKAAQQAPVQPPPVEVAPAPTAEPASATQVTAAVDEPQAALTAAEIGLSDIGKELSGDALPSQSKVPTLKRIKMPEFLVNIPKPVPRPAAPEPASAPAGPASGELPVAGRAREDRPEEQKGGARGRKLIYDRRRDAMTGGAEGRVRGKKRAKTKAVTPVAPAAAPKAEKRHLRIEDTITVANLAHQMSVKATEVIKKLFDLGILATVNHALDMDTVELVAADYGFTAENVGFDLEQYLQKADEAPGVAVSRSPVVTVMGHVDHGKTSLLDAIRKTHHAAKEAGGITQHIGAYMAEVHNKGRVVFLDTPGHEAFTAMRARGAKATDVIVLVVAADDGVMPQTVEAINHAKAATVPIIVAVNKIDKPGADIEKVRRELAEHGVVSEEWGGDVTFCEVSAKTGKGIDQLLEMLALQSEVLDLTANPDCDARGLVIESRLEKGRGPVATLLVQQGTLRKGQYVVSGAQYCRVRLMLDDAGRPLEVAGPATPVEVIGFETVTMAGDEFYVVADEKKGKAIAEHRIEKQREKEALKTSRRTLDDMLQATATGATSTKELNLIIKADVHGSAEALKAALGKIEGDEVSVRVLHSAVGGVTETDINLAATAKGVIIAFNVKPEAKGKRLADDLGVQIRQYSVIYDAIDDVTSMLEGMLTPIVEEVVLGHAEVRELFNVPKLGTIAGCNVTDGKLDRSTKLRLWRGKELVWEGEFASLKRFKDDVKEVAMGYDCGVGLQGFNKMLQGDKLECYEIKKTPRKLQSTSGRPQQQAATA